MSQSVDQNDIQITMIYFFVLMDQLEWHMLEIYTTGPVITKTSTYGKHKAFAYDPLKIQRRRLEMGLEKQTSAVQPLCSIALKPYFEQINQHHEKVDHPHYQCSVSKLE